MWTSNPRVRRRSGAIALLLGPMWAMACGNGNAGSDPAAPDSGTASSTAAVSSSGGQAETETEPETETETGAPATGPEVDSTTGSDCSWCTSSGDIEDSSTTASEPEPGMRVIAHRGFSEVAPENTIAAFDAAVAAGAHLFELDIRRTADGELVCLHDVDLDRTTDCTGLVADYTLADLSGCDAGSWFGPDFVGEGVPRLADVLSRYANDPVEIVIEIKAYDAAADIVDLVYATQAQDRVMMISFSLGALENALAAVPDDGSLRASWLVSDPAPEQVDEALAAGLSGLSWQATVEQAEIDLAHAADLDVNVWTVNDVRAMQHWLDSGVDFLTTDRPDVALEILPD